MPLLDLITENLLVAHSVPGVKYILKNSFIPVNAALPDQTLLLLSASTLKVTQP
jgi:hypothetical protein